MESEFKKDENEIGALWSKKSNKGLVFYSGVINQNVKKDQQIVMFPVEQKSERSPAFRILKSKSTI